MCVCVCGCAIHVVCICFAERLRSWVRGCCDERSHNWSPAATIRQCTVIDCCCCRCSGLKRDSRSNSLGDRWRVQSGATGVLSIAAAAAVMMPGLMTGWCRALRAAWLAASPDGIAVVIGSEFSYWASAVAQLGLAGQPPCRHALHVHFRTMPRWGCKVVGSVIQPCCLTAMTRSRSRQSFFARRRALPPRSTEQQRAT